MNDPPLSRRSSRLEPTLFTRLARACLLLCLPLGLAACGAGDGTLEEVDPGAAPEKPNYDEHIAPIMKDYCTACHAQDAGGEGAEVMYDTCRSVVRNWGGLRQTAFSDKTMPPPTAYTLPSSDVLTLERWWSQGHDCP